MIEEKTKFAILISTDGNYFELIVLFPVARSAVGLVEPIPFLAVFHDRS